MVRPSRRPYVRRLRRKTRVIREVERKLPPVLQSIVYSYALEPPVDSHHIKVYTTDRQHHLPIWSPAVDPIRCTQWQWDCQECRPKIRTTLLWILGGFGGPEVAYRSYVERYCCWSVQLNHQRLKRSFVMTHLPNHYQLQPGKLQRRMGVETWRPWEDMCAIFGDVEVWTEMMRMEVSTPPPPVPHPLRTHPHPYKHPRHPLVAVQGRCR